MERSATDTASGCGIVKSRSLLYNRAAVVDPSNGLRGFLMEGDRGQWRFCRGHAGASHSVWSGTGTVLQ